MSSTFNTRIQLKHDTAARWDATNGFIPKAGEIIIYDTDLEHDAPRIKIGNNVTDVKNLPFLTEPNNLIWIGSDIPTSNTYMLWIDPSEGGAAYENDGLVLASATYENHGISVSGATYADGGLTFTSGGGGLPIYNGGII